MDAIVKPRLTPGLTALALSLVLFAPITHGNRGADTNSYYLTCLERASERLDIPLSVLLTVKIAETGMNLPVSITRENINGTQDHGIYQINDFWLPHLKHYDIDKEKLQDVCYATWSAALILNYEYHRHQSWTKAIAYYHSPTPAHQTRYLKRISKIMETLK